MLPNKASSKAASAGFPPVLTSAVTLVEAAYHKDSRVTGVPTALIDLDDKLGGLQRSDLVILAGRPSMGKTALAITIGANAAATARSAWTPRIWPATTMRSGSSPRDVGRAVGHAPALGAGRAELDDLRRGKLRDADFRKVVQASQDWPRGRCSSTTRRRSR